MTRASLSSIYRQATLRHDSGVSADDVARLAAGERLGQRHDAAVEALAGSAHALLAFRAAQALIADAGLAGAQGSNVAALPRRAVMMRPALAVAAGVMALALVAGLLLRLEPTLRADSEPAVAAAVDDRIFSVSYEADGAIVVHDGAIFVDAFDG